MQYRPEIDGLRAVAVLPVILFHAGFSWFGGGFVGVDVFFVISGYLITTIIAKDLDEQRFSISRFYERRARRILPVLFLVILTTIPFAWMLLPPNDLATFAASVISVLTFASNFFFLYSGDYFAVSTDLHPLVHTWSLAVEEQFYLLFPLFLMLLWKYGRRRITLVLAVVAMVSLVAAQWGAHHKPLGTFYLLPTRAWELAIGALVALLAPVSANMAQWKIEVSCAFGLALIALSIFVFDQTTPFPSLYALLPTAGAALVIRFSNPATFVGRLLSSKPLVQLGLISYSAYLWHQPLLAFARFRYERLDQETTWFILCAVLLLSAVSWKWVEQPARSARLVGGKTVFVASALAGASTAIIGVTLLLISKTMLQGSEELRLAKALLDYPAVYVGNIDDRQFIEDRLNLARRNPDAIVVGSSRVMQISTNVYGDDVLNLAVSGASIEDDIAIVGAATTNLKPATILIGADPWLFNKSSGQDRWKSFEDLYWKEATKIGVEARSVRTKAIGMPAASAGALATLYDETRVTAYGADDDQPSLYRLKIRQDGSRVYDIAYASMSETQKEKGFRGLLKYGMSPLQLSSESEGKFFRFLAYYSSRSRVVLVLSPYHPGLYNLMKEEAPIYENMEAKFRQIAVALHIEIVGSYDPDLVGCNASEFFDGMHPRPSCMSKAMAYKPH